MFDAPHREKCLDYFTWYTHMTMAIDGWWLIHASYTDMIFLSCKIQQKKKLNI